MIKNSIVFFSITFCTVILLSCSKESASPVQDIYAYGSLNNIAMVWKNGKESPITDGTKTSFAAGGTISGSDIYIAGYEIVNGIKTAKYWKNGVETVLSNGAQNEEAVAITVVAGDVYVAGVEKGGNFGGNWVGKYWKNGASTILSNNSVFTFVTGIAVISNNVYVTGIESKPDSVIGKYWKNGVAHKVDPRAKISYAWGVVGSGSDVYIVGSIINSNGSQTPKYWKNGIETILQNGSKASRISVVGSDVFIAGDNLQNAIYWKNGLVNQLALEANSLTESTCIAIAKSGDVYVTGAVYNVTGGQRGSLLWKNGILQEPFASSKSNTIVQGVMLVN